MSPHDTRTLDLPRRRPSRGAVRLLTPVYPVAQPPVELGTTPLVIGRAGGDADLLVADDRLSRTHFDVTVVQGAVEGVRVRDLGSKNGTWLDGRRVETEYVRGETVVRAGDVLFVISEVERPVGEPPLPRAGVSAALWWAEYRARRLAPTDVPVLVCGPSGAGKERIARLVHEASGRPGPLISVNCATFTRELLAGELFGHVAGAFSGAKAAREGLFVSARGGTLFLDEIAEMPLDQQPALLRALQEGRVRPVGSDREVAVDVRVVAATHQDLRGQVEAGGFRGDLFARLAGARVDLPPLRERRVDVLPLFQRFVGASWPIAAEAAEALLLYDWPFNVRELQHAAAAAAVDAGALGEIALPLLPAEVQDAYFDRAAPAEEGQLDRDRLEALLRAHRGNVSEVGRAVGLTRQQVYRRLRLFGLQAESYREEG